MNRQQAKGRYRISREKAGAKGFITALQGPRSEKVNAPYIGLQPVTQTTMPRQPRAGNDVLFYLYAIIEQRI